MLSRKDFDELLKTDAEPAVSLYLPTEIAGREVRQGPIRLKNLLATAVERLAAYRRTAARDLLAPAEALVEDAAFWRHREAGLAIFLARGFCRNFALPMTVPEEAVVGPHFHIKPLLPVLEAPRQYWLLTVSAARARLYQGGRDGLAEYTPCRLPQGIDQVAAESEYQETHYAGPVRRGGLAKAQVLGDAPEEARKAELIELLRRTATAVERHVKGKQAPLILAAHPEVAGNFRRLANWPELLSDGIAENPDALTQPELQRRAEALIEQRTGAERQAMLDQLNALLGQGGGRATTRSDEIVKAARYGRVDRLFLAGDDHLWGRFDEPADRVVMRNDAAGDGDIDLLDYAALMTLRQGGGITLIDRAALPANSLAAAMLRY